MLFHIFYNDLFKKSILSIAFVIIIIKKHKNKPIILKLIYFTKKILTLNVSYDIIARQLKRDVAQFGRVLRSGQYDSQFIRKALNSHKPRKQAKTWREKNPK